MNASGDSSIPSSVFGNVRRCQCPHPILRAALWARVPSGHIAAAPPANAMNSRRLTRSPPMRLVRVSDAQTDVSIAAVRLARSTEVCKGSGAALNSVELRVRCTTISCRGCCGAEYARLVPLTDFNLHAYLAIELHRNGIGSLN